MIALCKTAEIAEQTAFWYFVVLSQMSTLEMAVEELKRLPGSKVEEVAALIHQLAQDVDKQKRQAFAATFGSMSADEADAFQRVIDESCERID